MRTVLEAAGAVAHVAARVEREPHLVQLAPEVLHLPCHQVLQPPCAESAPGWGGSRRVRFNSSSTCAVRPPLLRRLLVSWDLPLTSTVPAWGKPSLASKMRALDLAFMAGHTTCNLYEDVFLLRGSSCINPPRCMDSESRPGARGIVRACCCQNRHLHGQVLVHVLHGAAGGDRLQEGVLLCTLLLSHPLRPARLPVQPSATTPLHQRFNCGEGGSHMPDWLQKHNVGHASPPGQCSIITLQP